MSVKVPPSWLLESVFIVSQIWAWVSDWIHSLLLDVITCPCPNCNYTCNYISSSESWYHQSVLEKLTPLQHKTQICKSEKDTWGKKKSCKWKSLIMWKYIIINSIQFNPVENNTKTKSLHRWPEFVFLVIATYIMLAIGEDYFAFDMDWNVLQDYLHISHWYRTKCAITSISSRLSGMTVLTIKLP